MGIKKMGSQIGYHTVRATADVAGGWAGAWLGLQAGGTVGGFACSVPGVIVGGGIGMILGAFGGGELATKVVDFIYGR